MPPVEPQRREFSADPIMHGIMARLAQPNEIPAAESKLREVLYRPRMMRNCRRSSAPISGTVLASSAVSVKALLPKPLPSRIGICVSKTHSNQKSRAQRPHTWWSLAPAQIALAPAYVYDHLVFAPSAEDLEVFSLCLRPDSLQSGCPAIGALQVAVLDC